MTRIRVPIIGGNNKSVLIDSTATKGSTIGTDLLMPDGTPATPAKLAAYLGVTPNPPNKSPNSSGGSVVAVPGKAGPPGDDGGQGADGDTVVGPQGLPGAPSVVPGPPGPPGAVIPPDDPRDGYDGDPVPGPAGAASTIPGPAGPAGVTVVIPGEDGAPGADGDHIPGAPGAAGTGSSANVTPDTHPASADPADDEFEVAALDTGGTRFSGATAWGWQNQGAATAAYTQGGLVLTGPTGADHISAVMQAIPTGSWKYRTKMQPYLPSQFEQAGLVLYNSGNSKAIVFGLVNSTGTAWHHHVYRYSSLNAFASTLYDVDDSTTFGSLFRPMYHEIEYDGTSFYFRVSSSGYTGVFKQLATETIANYIVAITHIGLYANPNTGGTAPVLAADWFRRFA